MLDRLFVRFGKRRVIGTTVGILVVGALGLYFILTKNSAPADTTAPSLPSVSVMSVRDLATSNTITAVGTVTAISEARLQTEAGGRVTAVNVKIGDTVRAGTILASIENSSERASLIQAQGAYEAALAGAKQSDSGSRDTKTGLTAAKQAAASAIKDSYTAVNGTLVSSIDQFYSQPQSSIPGLRISGNALALNTERVSYQTLMPAWQKNVSSLNDNDLVTRLNEAEQNTKRTIAYVESFITATNQADSKDLLDGTPVNNYTAGLLAQSAALNGTLSKLQAARNGLSSAEEAVVRSASSDTSGTVSLANAQVKIALGSLAAAQSAFEKTMVRSPISGVVNALYLKAGEYVSPSTPAGIVANNNGLEIATALNEADAGNFKVGDTVTIDQTASGTITAIAGAIDPTTGKVAVKVSVNENTTLKNGSTVSISFVTQAAAEATTITIPLSAVKMTGSGPIAFMVNEDNTLKGTVVTLGAISGESVTVDSGLTLDSRIVVDARGLKEGQKVDTSK